MIPNRNGYQAYQRNKYDTASPHKLILMLYEGAIRFSDQAVKSLNSGDIIETNRFLQKAQDIIYELIACLNHKEGGEIASNLHNIYLYVIDLLVKANTEKDAAKIEEAISLIASIKSAWEQIGKEVSIGHA
jgi:flagellar biosynthetic protein FliS